MPDEPAPKPKTWVTPQLKAAVMSKFFPGAGQMYNQEWAKGGVFMAAFLVTIVLAIFYTARGFYVVYQGIVSMSDPYYTGEVNSLAELGPGLLFMGASILVWLMSIMDAWKTGKARVAAAAPAVIEERPPEPRRDPVLPPPPPARG